MFIFLRSDQLIFKLVIEIFKNMAKSFSFYLDISPSHCRGMLYFCVKIKKNNWLKKWITVFRLNILVTICALDIFHMYFGSTNAMFGNPGWIVYPSISTTNSNFSGTKNTKIIEILSETKTEVTIQA